MQRIRPEDGKLVEIVEIADSMGTLNDASGTIATPNVSQEQLPADPNRDYLFIQNLHTGGLWVNFGSDATVSQPSIKLNQDEKFVMSRASGFMSTQSVHLIGGGSNQPFTIKWSS
jgi:hypothetical protein